MRKQLYPKKPKQQNSNCPNCGWEIRRPSTFETAIGDLVNSDRPGSYEAYRETPVRAATFEADVLVPAAQSLFTALTTTLPTIAISMWARWEWYAPVVVGAVTILASWSSAMVASRKSLSLVEQISRTVDDGKEPENSGRKNPSAIQLEVVKKEAGFAASMKIIDLPKNITEPEFREFCVDVLAGKSMARKDWAGSGRLFSRDQYDDLMKAIEAAGLAIPVPGRSRRLTQSGKDAIKKMIRET